MKTIRTLTELLDLVTELKFASFIVARDKKKIGLKEERSTEMILSTYFKAIINDLFQFKYA